jgi:hypothetical protein
VGLERGPPSPVSTTEGLLGRNSSGSGLESRENGRGGFGALTARHPLSSKSDTNFADMRLFLGLYSSFEGWGHGVVFLL